MTPAEVRALVPAARRRTYLDAAASSPLPTPVADAVREHLREVEEEGDDGFPIWIAERERLRARLARFIGATAREVAILGSTSAGFSVVAAMLAHRGVREVVTLEGEFPSTAVPMLARGMTVRAARRRPDGSFTVDDVAAAMTKDTGAVALSVVQFASGFRIDLEGVSRLCKDRKVALCLNASQALGQVPVDVGALGADFLCAACHKWMMAGYGMAAFFARAEWLDACPLPIAGWTSVEPEVLWQTLGGAATEETPAALVARGARLRKDAAALEGGGGTWSLYPALDAALELHEAVGVDRTRAHVLELQRALRAGLRARGFAPNAPDDPERTSGICVIPVAGDPAAAVRALSDERVVVTPRGGGVRLSTHVYNDASDVDAALAAIDRAKVRPA